MARGETHVDSGSHYEARYAAKETCGAYDATRGVRGSAIILGSLLERSLATSTSLSALKVLDAGCGTGLLLKFLLDSGVGTSGGLQGFDMGEGMLAHARQRLGENAHVKLSVGSVLDMSAKSDSLDALTITQVLHHLVNVDSPSLEPYSTVFREAHRVLQPGGKLIINCSTPVQVRDGFWWTALIPKTCVAAQKKFMPATDMEAGLRAAGFSTVQVIVPTSEVLQAPYADVRHVLDEQYRAADSFWSMVPAEELEQALATAEELLSSGRADKYMAEREALRAATGQITFIVATK